MGKVITALLQEQVIGGSVKVGIPVEECDSTRKHL
jgi:hypothetical protein